jgi:hypothetical protein
LLLVGAGLDVFGGGFQGKVIFIAFLVWLAIAGLYLFPPFRKISLVSSACYALVINAAALVGLVLAFTGRNIKTWKPDR